MDDGRGPVVLEFQQRKLKIPFRKAERASHTAHTGGQRWAHLLQDLLMFSNKSLSDFGIPVILSTIYIHKEKIGRVKYNAVFRPL